MSWLRVFAQGVAEGSWLAAIVLGIGAIAQGRWVLAAGCLGASLLLLQLATHLRNRVPRS